MSEHLDLDVLADVLAGETEAPAHLPGCPDCSADLDALRTASDDVRARLALLPTPVLPPEVADRLDAALADEPPFAEATSGGGAVTTLPMRSSSRAQRWLPAAAAAVLVLGGGAFGLAQLGGDDQADSATTAADSGARTLDDGFDLVRNSTGRDYTGRGDLAAAAPGLLAGGPEVAAAAPAPGVAGGTAQDTRATAEAPAAAMTVDALATLRTDAGLAECLLALLPPDDPSATPRALDYGSFKGTPALVVLLPSALPRKLDVFVVGAGCSRANDSVLFYTSVDAP